MIRFELDQVEDARTDTQIVAIRVVGIGHRGVNVLRSNVVLKYREVVL
jgi:hypothetical protein